MALVELEEGPAAAHATSSACQPDAVACEMPVKVVFDDVADGVSVPKFVPLNAPAR